MNLRGIIPKDLPYYGKMPYPLADRIRDALAFDAELEHQQALVAIEMNEQPGSIPCNNPVGLMSWADRSPYGWKTWPRNPPIAYAIIPEGAGGMLGVFLAFADVKDALARLMLRIQTRDIRTAEDYADKWVSEPSLRAQSINGFNAALEKVKAAWPK